MQEQTFFSKHLRRAVFICVSTWPPLKIAMQSGWINENKDVLATENKYAQMDQAQLVEALSNEMFIFIMEHDVDQHDIENYLLDMLEDIFNTQTEDKTAKVIGYQLELLIKDLQKGQTHKMQELEELYERIKNKSIQSKFVGESDQQESEDQIQQQMEQQEQEVPKLISTLTPEQQALEDQGWTVIKKKK